MMNGESLLCELVEADQKNASIHSGDMLNGCIYLHLDFSTSFPMLRGTLVQQLWLPILNAPSSSANSQASLSFFQTIEVHFFRP